MGDVSSLNLTDPHLPHAGWIASSWDRGSIDILWSCCFTICLCCWVTTHPNAISSTEKSYHRFLDKFHLAMVGILGPDFLFGIAMGQLSSAMRSVKAFKRDKHLCNGAMWTLAHAFFTDMGGIYLKSPDFDEGFPITAGQLHYLVKQGHVDFPDMNQMHIAERNAVDTLSKLLTIWQVLWFSVTELERVKQGFPMTTLELTALSYVFVMVATELCWLRKPSIMKPRSILTKNNKTVEEIRAHAKQHTHPGLTDDWYRTPLTFIDGSRFRIDTHWSFYTQLSHLIHLHLPSRRIKTRPWDRFPSDLWMPCEKLLILAGTTVLLGFSASFAVAWNFFFPTYAEQLLWRIFSVYHAVFTLYGGFYYVIEVLSWHRERKPDRNGDQAAAQLVVTPEGAMATKQESMVITQAVSDPESLQSGQRRPRVTTFADGVGVALRRLTSWIASWRNISPDGDPAMTLRLRLVIPVTITCVMYVVGRIFFYVEDFVSLREQPVGVYITVNRFLPFLGNE